MPARLQYPGCRAARTNQPSGFHLDEWTAPPGPPAGRLADSRVDGRPDKLVVTIIDRYKPPLWIPQKSPLLCETRQRRATFRPMAPFAFYTNNLCIFTN